jgi:hypothetical protein
MRRGVPYTERFLCGNKIIIVMGMGSYKGNNYRSYLGRFVGVPPLFRRVTYFNLWKGILMCMSLHLKRSAHFKRAPIATSAQMCGP